MKSTGAFSPMTSIHSSYLFPWDLLKPIIVYYDMRLGSGYYRIEETIIKTKFCNTTSQTCIVQYCLHDSMF
ncbi:hypothetical protein C0J52_02784 [Blattella germanica]|nr:hypothetical protein C0J52_02784 [Blattella germanica]